MNETKATHSLPDLEQLYLDAEHADSEIFSEMRVNVLLVAGEHYTKKTSVFFKRVRDSKELSDQQKLRLTKNHIQKICKLYVNNILSMAPGVGFRPRNENELQDQKSAELHHAVWMHARDKYQLDEYFEEACDDFVQIGEVACKIIFDPNSGPITGFEALVDEVGQPVMDDSQQYQADKSRPVFQGEFVVEPIHGFNLLRPQDCIDMRKAPWLALRKMVQTSHLKAQFPDSAKKIQESMNETMMVFDSVRGGYRKAGNEVMVKEFYFRPCAQYPNGYFFIATKEAILSEGELPGGVFPIVFELFERIQTTPRGRSPIKTMRPYQAEINRAASKMAEHQITLGDDKLLIQNGTKISSGVALPGVRSINYTGMTPGILEGRDGSQYLNYMQAQIEELYRVMLVQEDSVENPQGQQLDAYALLYRSASQKKRFRRYTGKFERYMISFAETFMQLMKLYLSDEELTKAVGKPEQVNLAEFRGPYELNCQIKLDAQSDDVETKLGKQLVLNHLVQFTGNKLEKEDIGKLVRLMPYMNMEEGFSDLTLDYDGATNDILALDRGEVPPVNEYDNHIYMIKRLVGRMRKADFRYLPGDVQMNYVRKLQAHQKAEALRQEAIQRAESGYIPSGGPLITCRGLTVPDPQSPQKVRELRLPYEAIDWLAKQLEVQGKDLQKLEQMNQGALAQMAEMLQSNPEIRGSEGMPPRMPN